jgi:hypothetical protein
MSSRKQHNLTSEQLLRCSGLSGYTDHLGNSHLIDVNVKNQTLEKSKLDSHPDKHQESGRNA